MRPAPMFWSPLAEVGDVKKSLRSQYVFLIRKAREYDGYPAEARLATLLEYGLAIESHPGLTGEDRTILRKEIRDSIDAIQRGPPETRGTQL